MDHRRRGGSQAVQDVKITENAKDIAVVETELGSVKERFTLLGEMDSKLDDVLKRLPQP